MLELVEEENGIQPVAPRFLRTVWRRRSRMDWLRLTEDPGLAIAAVRPECFDVRAADVARPAECPASIAPISPSLIRTNTSQETRRAWTTGEPCRLDISRPQRSGATCKTTARRCRSRSAASSILPRGARRLRWLFTLGRVRAIVDSRRLKRRWRQY